MRRRFMGVVINFTKTYVVDKLSPLMKREEFGGLLEEREDILFTSKQTLSRLLDFTPCLLAHVNVGARTFDL